jgi:hypothetical protein
VPQYCHNLGKTLSFMLLRMWHKRRCSTQIDYCAKGHRAAKFPREWCHQTFIGVPSENGPDRTLRLTQKAEFAFTEVSGVVPLVVAGEIDVLLAERREMLLERPGRLVPHRG